MMIGTSASVLPQAGTAGIGRGRGWDWSNLTVIDAHSKALDATKAFFRLPEFEPGRIEINMEVPIENYLALYETVLNYSYHGR